MVSLLLAVIYLAFISLGLPDSLLGSAWPVMHVELGAPLSAMGAVTMIISAGTVVSSLASDLLTRKFGTGLVTAVSVLLTAGAMIGFSFAGAFWVLCLIAVPYGLGAGGVDAALNNYVALHYQSRHMSWLHCFWGVGTIVSPFIMSACLTGAQGWAGGYRIVSYIQFALVAVLFCSLPLWKKPAPQELSKKPLTLPQTLRLKGVAFMLFGFFAYSAVEATAMNWASSYLTEFRGVSAERAAMFASLFFIGITAGRLLSGFVSEKLGDRTLIRVGVGVIVVGIVLIALPVQTDGCALAGFVVVGLGCAPVYPCIIHSTPALFGAEKSQAMIGMQMAFAYIGGLASPLFGALIGATSVLILPAYLAVFLAVMIAMHEIMVVRTAKNKI